MITLDPDLSTREGCLTKKEYLFRIFKSLQLRQALHLRFCHITCCINRNIEHELLVAQWDALKVAWIQLKEALNQLKHEELERDHASTSRQ